MERLGLNDNKKYAFVMKLLFCISNYIRFLLCVDVNILFDI
jgi:hypothetical protein